MWANSVSSEFDPLIYSSTSCTRISGTSLNDPLGCSIIGTDEVFLTSAFVSTISASQAVSFSMSGIRTPATVSTINYVTIST